MIDKAPYVRRGDTPYGFPPDLLDLAAQDPRTAASVDSGLASAEPLRTGSPPRPGGHRKQPLGGTLMRGTAITVEDALASAEVVSAQSDSLAFFTAYQRAVETLGDLRFRFSDGRILLIAEAMAPTPP